MKPELKYGLINGAVVCLWIAVEHWLGLRSTHPELAVYLGYCSNLIPLTTLFLLLQTKRAAVYDGRLSLGAGIGAGIYASFVAALIVYSFLTLYSHFINPAWIEQALEAKVAAWRAELVIETEIQKRITTYRDAHTPTGLIGTILVGITLMGGLFSLVLTLVVRQLPHRPV